MFTGIVTDVGEVLAVVPRAQGLHHRLTIGCSYDRATIVDGASIACNGVCMTVVGAGVENGRTWFDVDAALRLLHHHTPESIYNMDESGFSVGSSQSLRALFYVCNKASWKVVTGRQKWVTAIECVSAAGEALVAEGRVQRAVAAITHQPGRHALVRGSASRDEDPTG